MDILFIIGGVSVLVLPFVIGHFINKKDKKHHDTTQTALEKKYSEGDILLAQQGFGPDELLREYYFND